MYSKHPSLGKRHVFDYQLVFKQSIEECYQAFFSVLASKDSLESPIDTWVYKSSHLLMFYKVVDAILLFVGKENANERKESLLSICRVQLFFCKDTTFPHNFQGFREKYLKGMRRKKKGDSRIGGESPIL